MGLGWWWENGLLGEDGSRLPRPDLGIHDNSPEGSIKPECLIDNFAYRPGDQELLPQAANPPGGGGTHTVECRAHRRLGRAIAASGALGVAALLVASGPMAPDLRAADGGVTTRITGGAGRPEPNANSIAPFVSADGRFVVFQTRATNLVAGGNPEGPIRADLVTGRVEAVESPFCRPVTEAFCTVFGVTAHGRYVAMITEEDGGRSNRAVLHDMDTGLSHEVSVDAQNRGVAVNLGNMSVSADGRFVSFQSTFDHEGIQTHNGDAHQVFVRDMVEGVTRQVSVDAAGRHPWGGSALGGRLSGDGRTIAFISQARGITADTPDDASFYGYVRDLGTGQTTMVTRTPDGQPASGSAGGLSYDGRYVTVRVDENDPPGSWGSMVLDRRTGTKRRASVDSAGNDTGDASSGRLTEDGQSVLFRSRSELLVPGQDRYQDHFIHRFATGETVLVEEAADGGPPNRYHDGATFDADGRVAVFASAADNIVADDDNGVSDIFVRRYPADSPATRAPREADLPRHEPQPGPKPPPTTGPTTGPTAPSQPTTGHPSEPGPGGDQAAEAGANRGERDPGDSLGGTAEAGSAARGDDLGSPAPGDVVEELRTTIADAIARGDDDEARRALRSLIELDPEADVSELAAPLGEADSPSRLPWSAGAAFAALAVGVASARLRRSAAAARDT